MLGRLSVDRSIDPYLSCCETIDFRCADILHLAASLAKDSPQETTKACFEFTRDRIRHSADFRQNPVTCKASEVLAHGTGFCYAKSHLLTALLRANGLTAGMCYQRLSMGGEEGAYCLHGLNAVYLPEVGWYRLDARGNRHDIHAEFHPPEEFLAFRPTLPGEYDLPGVYATPLPVVVDALSSHETWDQLLLHLPDITPVAI